MLNFTIKIFWLQLNEIENICKILSSETRNHTLVYTVEKMSTEYWLTA